MLLKKYEVYTISEFMNREIIEELNTIDRAIEHLKKHKEKYMLAVVLIAITIDSATLQVFADDATLWNSLDKVGGKLLGLMRGFGYWIGVILCSKDVIKHSMRGHLDSIGTVIAMWAVAFGALYFIPWIFDMIKTMF